MGEAVVRQTAVSMDTPVTIQVVGGARWADCAERIARAFGWFRQVEECCTRFDAGSEVMKLARRVQEPVVVSPILYTVVHFALAVARASDGAFDPTVGLVLERRGFNRNYRTGRMVVSAIEPERCSYRDVWLDDAKHAITLQKPLVLDLGAVAKGFAVDLAARELLPFGNFSVDAGGDVLVKGHNADGESWRVGIRHPRWPNELIDVVQVTDAAVCTSGSYERTATTGDSHHIIDPCTGVSPTAVASVTCIAPTAMAADALATAAFVLGPSRGVAFLERQGVDALIVSSTLEKSETPNFARYRS